MYTDCTSTTTTEKGEKVRCESRMKLTNNNISYTESFERENSAVGRQAGKDKHRQQEPPSSLTLVLLISSS